MGLVTRPLYPNAFARCFAKVVFPAPRPPVKANTSPPVMVEAIVFASDSAFSTVVVSFFLMGDLSCVVFVGSVSVFL